jgi:hypothetical protein
MSDELNDAYEPLPEISLLEDAYLIVPCWLFQMSLNPSVTCIFVANQYSYFVAGLLISVSV